MKNYSDKAAMAEALSSLRRYIRSMYISVEAPDLDESALEEYFNSDDAEVCARFEKIIGIAAIQAVYDDPVFPDSTKERVARRASSELTQAFRGAKIEYEYAAGKYGGNAQKAARTYERKKKEIFLCKKAAFLDRTKRNLPRMATKIAAKEGVKAALTAAGAGVAGPVGALVGLAVGITIDMVWYCTPRSVKEKVKKVAGDIANKARNTIKAVAQKVKESPVVQKAVQVVEKYVAPVIKPVYETAKKVVEKAGATVSKCWKKFKSLFA